MDGHDPKCATFRALPGHARFNISTKNKTESAQEFGRYPEIMFCGSNTQQDCSSDLPFHILFARVLLPVGFFSQNILNIPADLFHFLNLVF